MRAIAILILCSLLLACGFEPLYARRTGGGSTYDRLSAVYIEPIENRTGQQLYNALRDRMNPEGAPQRPTYRLSVKLDEARAERATRSDEFATRADVTVTAVYKVTRASDGTQLFASRSQVTSSFNILGSEAEFANLASEKEARARAIMELAQVMTSRIGVALSPQAPTASRPDGRAS
jgi:LPS-assembly lipoprotein